ncbi:MAG: VTT domain-containing protein [Candidatus Fermentibacteraceae bacterium]|nr:VTT domain-containing protein [Candidatus Fermentibacteraceae bacterium]
MTEAVWQFFQGVSTTWHSVFMGLLAFIETLFPPFPGDILYIAMSGLGAARNIPVVLLWIPGFLGCMVATLLLYRVGTSSKLEKLESLVVRTSGKDGWDRSKRLLARHGAWLLVFSRFIPGIRSLLVVAAASSGMKKSAVLGFTASSVVLWYGLMVTAGTILGAELNSASEFMSDLTAVLLITVLAAVAAGGAVFLVRLKRQKK